jgi:carbohydrate-selective porin OprB
LRLLWIACSQATLFACGIILNVKVLSVYALQLTPTIKIQPDFQMIWDPVFHKDASQATVFQIQLVLAW